MFTRVTLLAAFLPAIWAFSDTHPIIAWSSHASNVLSKAASSKSTESSALIKSLLSHESICDYDAVVLVDQPGLHAADLRVVAPSSSLAQTLLDAPSVLQMPYMRRSVHDPFETLAEAVAERCGSRVMAIQSGDLEPHLSTEPQQKYVVRVGMPTLEGSSESRKELMADHELLLSSDLEKIALAFPKHFVVYAGWAQSIGARQSLEDESGSAFEDHLTAAQAGDAVRRVAPSDSGILKRYQLLTPALIMALVIVFFVLVPIVLLGVSSLASIQSSVRLDAPKGFNAAEKKNQ